MKSILYIGNKLNSSKSNVSAITIIGTLLEKEGYQLFYASSKINKVARLIDMLKACFAYRKRVDFVIIDTYSTWNFYFALCVSQLCRLLSIRYITRLNGGNLPLRLEKNTFMSKSIFNNAYVSISPSMFLMNKFKSFGYLNVTHVPNAINILDYICLSKQYGTPKLLWVRSFSKIYNPKLAIKVFSALKNMYPKAELCMVGPDSDGTLAEIKQLAQQLNLEVEFTGKLSKPEWIELSKNYNLFINTTNFDNTPLSVIEAMALGFPVVSTNVGGMPYLIEHKIDGLLVEPDNVEEMTKAICHIMDHQNDRETLIRNARYKVEQFDWANVKKLWFEILEGENSKNLT